MPPQRFLAPGRFTRLPCQASITVEHLKQLGRKLGKSSSQILVEAESNAFNMQMVGGVEVVKSDYDAPKLVVFPRAQR